MIRPASGRLGASIRRRASNTTGAASSSVPISYGETERFVSQRKQSKDPNFRDTKRVPDSMFDVLVRHVYKVLLTRGMVGTVIYSVDPETRHFLRTLIEPPAA